MKKGDTIQGRTLHKGGHYLRKYGIYFLIFQSIRRAVEKRNEMRILQLTHAKKGLVPPQQDQNISGRSDSSFLLCKGSYNEQYCTLEQIGKGAFGCVKTAFRRSDRRMVSTLHLKAELLQECIFFPHPFICTSRFSNERVRN